MGTGDRPQPGAPLWAAKLLLVTGKGGTGKTTFAAALAAIHASRGDRTLLLEIDNQRPSTTAIFGRAPEDAPVEIRPGLYSSNVCFGPSLARFIEQMVPAPRVVRLVLDNRIVGRFIDFTPGSREMVVLARIAALARDYDRVIVDMPASGHAFSLIDIVRSARGLFRSGPVRALAESLHAWLADPSTRIAYVALPEDMVVTETIETHARLRGRVGGPPIVFLNRATLPSLTDPERALINRIAASPLSEDLREFARAGRWEDTLEQGTAQARDQLAAAIGAPPLLVPPAVGHPGPAGVAAAVAVHLGRSVGVTKRDLAWA
jgi:arsenite-transporting ATPase